MNLKLKQPYCGFSVGTVLSFEDAVAATMLERGIAERIESAEQSYPPPTPAMLAPGEPEEDEP